MCVCVVLGRGGESRIGHQGGVVKRGDGDVNMRKKMVKRREGNSGRTMKEIS